LHFYNIPHLLLKSLLLSDTCLKFGCCNQAYDINADNIAGEIAAAVGAEKLILLTDVAGILEDRNDPNSLIRDIDINGIRKMIEEGKVAEGIIPKVECCIKSLTQGVHTASIIDSRIPHSLLLEILTGEAAGTMIRN
jgi:acetylglutamate kinase